MRRAHDLDQRWQELIHSFDKTKKDRISELSEQSELNKHNAIHANIDAGVGVKVDIGVDARRRAEAARLQREKEDQGRLKLLSDNTTSMLAEAEAEAKKKLLRIQETQLNKLFSTQTTESHPTTTGQGVQQAQAPQAQAPGVQKPFVLLATSLGQLGIIDVKNCISQKLHAPRKSDACKTSRDTKPNKPQKQRFVKCMVAASNHKT